MHAFLLTNTDPYKFAKEKNAKVLPFILQKIEDVKELKKIIKFSFSELNAIVIENIDTVTIEAANAFLKNLEEPNKNLIYILTAKNLSNVLPTIVSRCELVKLQNNKLQITNKFKITNHKEALTIKDRDEAIKFVENYLIYLESSLTLNPQLITACQDCLITIKNLKANGNVSLQLTNFVVKMSSTTISI